jgi:hypothetical protein
MRSDTTKKTRLLVLFRHDNYGFSVPGDALRVSLSRSTDYVAPLVNGATIACEVRLAVNLDKQTELAIIMSKEHGKINYG